MVGHRREGLREKGEKEMGRGCSCQNGGGGYSPFGGEKDVRFFLKRVLGFYGCIFFWSLFLCNGPLYL